MNPYSISSGESPALNYIYNVPIVAKEQIVKINNIITTTFKRIGPLSYYVHESIKYCKSLGRNDVYDIVAWTVLMTS